MNNRPAWFVSVAALMAALVAAGSWFHAHELLEQRQAMLVTTELEPIAMLVKDNQALLEELQSAPFAEKDSGILEAYLAKLRRDGIAKTAQMKQLLDTVAENNTTIATLITAYLPSARTPGFAAAANRFKTYAAAWRDRWNSSTELFMAGGNYPAASPTVPKDLLAAVQAEIAAAQ